MNKEMQKAKSRYIFIGYDSGPPAISQVAHNAIDCNEESNGFKNYSIRNYINVTTKN